MRAASSISVGMSFMNSVSSITEKPQAPSGRITAQTVPFKSSPTTGTWPRTRDSGMAMTSSGSIIVSMNRVRTRAWPRKRCRARAYAASTETASCSSSPPPAMTSELVK